MRAIEYILILLILEKSLIMLKYEIKQIKIFLTFFIIINYYCMIIILYYFELEKYHENTINS